ncbi:MAG: hypothetical protein K2X39_05885 [Silvanigrellaceae bacterium]|nr:hypothetical protein [Silvanigrellaceae bacterium]
MSKYKLLKQFYTNVSLFCLLAFLPSAWGQESKEPVPSNILDEIAASLLEGNLYLKPSPVFQKTGEVRYLTKEGVLEVVMFNSSAAIIVGGSSEVSFKFAITGSVTHYCTSSEGEIILNIQDTKVYELPTAIEIIRDAIGIDSFLFSRAPEILDYLVASMPALRGKCPSLNDLEE